jgi:hypothetical protein
MIFGRTSRLAARTAAVLVAAALPATSALAAPAAAAPRAATATVNATIVQLRIEGATSTIFEGPVLTTGHDITTAAGGTHHCDGTNGAANPTAGPTATSALDDAARHAGFTYDGTFSTTFDDFFITRIADSPQTATQFWGLLLNGQFTSVGGCQQRVALGDHVLWAFDAFNAAHFLKLTGPHAAHAGQPFTVTVTDLMTGDPISGATVGGQTTAANGTATITANQGIRRFKAQQTGSIRSNALTVLVI